jgi:integrase
MREYGRWERNGFQRVPVRAIGDAVALHSVVNAFLTAMRLRVNSGKLSAGTWIEYDRTIGRLVDAFGRNCDVASLTSMDFIRFRAKMTETLGRSEIDKLIAITRSIFNWAIKQDPPLIDKLPGYGTEFDKSDRKEARLSRQAKPKRFVAAADLRKMLNEASVSMRAMMLLGLNCAYGATDCAVLQRSDLAERPGWLARMRQKTAIERNCPLWPETIKALKANEAVRPKAKSAEDDGCVFISREGRRVSRLTWTADGKGVSRRDSVLEAYMKLKRRCGVNHPGGFYVMRHVFRTVADAVHDRSAIDRIMGHRNGTQADTYIEFIEDERLIAVSNYVRRWLFGAKKKS